MQAVGLLVDRVREHFSHLGVLALGLLLLEFRLQRWAQFLKGRLARCLDVAELDDVETKIGFHHIADGAFGQSKGSVLKRLDHGAAGKETQITALRR